MIGFVDAALPFLVPEVPHRPAKVSSMLRPARSVMDGDPVERSVFNGKWSDEAEENASITGDRRTPVSNVLVINWSLGSCYLN